MARNTNEEGFTAQEPVAAQSQPEGAQPAEAEQPQDAAQVQPPIENAQPQGNEPQRVDGAPVRTTPDGTAERVSFPQSNGDLPPLNTDVRNLANANTLPPEMRDQLDAAEERLRRQTRAEAGTDPENVEHRVFITPEEQSAQAATGRAGVLFGQATNYIVGERDIFASSVGQMITSYTLDAAAVTADANGDKVVMEGTVLQASGTKVAPRTAGAAVGVLRHRVNARYGDQDIGMVIGGRLNVNKLWDNGVFGSVAAGAITQLNALGIYLTSYDV